MPGKRIAPTPSREVFCALGGGERVVADLKPVGYGMSLGAAIVNFL